MWQYSYAVSGFPFPKDCRFSISFDPGLYSNLENPSPVVNADWDGLSIQPAPLLSDVGLYDALAAVKEREAQSGS